MLTGVCSGVARHLNLPVAWVRGAFVLSSFLGGAGIIFYVFLLVTVPGEGEGPEIAPLRRVFTQSSGSAQTSTSRGTSRRFPVAEIMLGMSFLAAGATLVAVQLGLKIDAQTILPALAVLVGVGLTWWLITDRNRPEKNLLPRVLGALALVAVGVLMFFVTAEEPSVFTVISAAVAVLAGVGLAIAPWLLRLNRELVAERSARARESERAEIAAHLHDSVLQTLALIQQRSEPGAEVARLARSQERELREWLFRDADGQRSRSPDSAGALLRQHAADLEQVHAVRFEVITVGEHTVAPEPIIAAAREAMLNAARHAGGDVTVYLENTKDKITIEITDRGPGFDVSEILDSRLGVRESIIGRMERAGGEARVTPGPGGSGAAVRLSLKREEADRAK